MRQKIVGLVLAAVTLGLGMSESSAAVIVQGDIIRFDRVGASGNGNGGEFSVYKKIGPGDWELVLRTFCIERNETLQANGSTEYIVGAISDRAVRGGEDRGAYANGDPIDLETDFLYANFRNLTLDSFDLPGADYSYNSDFWANALQDAIWYLEGELNSISTAAQKLVNLAEDAVSNGYQAQGVLAINLFAGNTPSYLLDGFDPYDGSTYKYQKNGKNLKDYHQQDVLYFVRTPPPSTQIPEPATLGIWTLLGALGWAGRRRAARKNARN